MAPTPTDIANRHFAAIVASSDDAIVSKDLDGIVQSWNAAAERIFGYSEAEMIGQSIRRIIPPERHPEEDEVLARIRCGQSVDHFETWRQRKDGTLIPISLTVSPVRDESGLVIGASKIARDISDRRRAEARVATAEGARADLHRRLLTLVEASQRVVGQSDVASVLSATVELAQELVAADGYVLWRHVGGDRWDPVRVVGVPDSFVSIDGPRRDGKPVVPPEGPLIVPDVLGEVSLAPRAQAYQQEGIVSLLIVPIRYGGRIPATIVFYYRQRHDFTEVEVQTAVALGNLAGAGLNNAELHEQERAAREEARLANRVKDQFLATLSHELRTPLNAIVGYTRMLLRGAVAADRQQRALETVERNASALGQIVEDLLDVSRIVTGKLQVKRDPLDLAPLVQHATETVLPMAEEKGVRVDIDVCAAPLTVSGDVNRLQQVVWNLVSNAVKFTPAGGSVRVELARVDSTARIRVQDSGVGIPPAFLDVIFEPFLQADNRSAHEHGGLGLGLAITRRLIEMHGGAIEAQSQGHGTGACFEVRLPLAAA